MSQTINHPNFIKALEQMRLEGSLRTLPDYHDCTVDFISNDYLGLLSRATQTTFQENFPKSGSRLIGGNAKSFTYLEDFLAECFGAEKSLFFNSGYSANLGFFSTIPQRNEIVLYDELIHASIRDGIRLGTAKSFGFKHNDLADLVRIRNNHANSLVFVVVEGIYSMDGDQAPLKELFDLAKKHDFYVIVDEAHSLGILGENGLGLSQEFSKHPKLFARILTFGKAIGAHGAAVLGSKDLIDFLIARCRPFIYTTALDASQAEKVRNHLNFAIRDQAGRDQLWEICSFFQEKFGLKQNSHIQPLRVQGIEKIIWISNMAKKQGIAIKGVWSPTVPLGSERFRISLHAFNTLKEIELLWDLFNTENDD